MADAQVNSAIANWGPRFTAQGVDPGDFARVTGGIESWKEWLGAWRDNGDLHAGLARDAAERGWLGALGVSLGGYYAARAAAFEPRLRAVVVCGGCYDYGALIRDRSPHSFATFSYGCGAATKDDAYRVA